MSLTPYAERAIEDALATGKAILKFISRNNVGDTGSHECGYYLPRHSWQLFTVIPPTRGTNGKANVRVIWGNGLVTDSVVTWYGTGTRREYRLTRFGKDFPYLDRENVGSLLVIVPRSYELFHAYVLDFDEDIEAVQAALGVQVLNKIGVYERGMIPPAETEDECVERHFATFLKHIADFPSPQEVSAAAREALESCLKDLRRGPLDARLLTTVEAEYRLFRLIERKICSPQVTSVFPDIDAFLQTAQTILQRRKSRAGLAFQNQVQHLFEEIRLPHEAQPNIDGRPDFIFPSAEAYRNLSHPTEKLIALALKTTCKDRWRQVLEEAKRVSPKYLLTLQPGISVNQLKEMKAANVILVVPKPLQKDYNVVDSQAIILTLEEFAQKARFQS